MNNLSSYEKVRYQVSLGVLLTMVFLLSSCSINRNISQDKGVVEIGSEKMIDDIIRLRETIKLSPNNIDAKIALRLDEKFALEYYTQSGDELFAERQYREALSIYATGLEISPYDYFLNLGASKAKAYIENEQPFLLANEHYNKGDYQSASLLLKKIIEGHPFHESAGKLLVATNAKLSERKKPPKSDLISLNFNEIDFPSALKFLGDSYGINFVFDQSVKEVNVTLDLKDITFYTALQLLLETTKHSYKFVDNRTLLIFTDTKDRHSQLTPIVIKTFQLRAMLATDMATLIKSVLGASGGGNITVNESGNSLIVKDTKDTVKLVAAIIEQNDIPRGEVLLDVEILEVNLSLTENQGIDYGAFQVGTTTSSVPLVGSIRDAIRANTTVSIPSIGISAFKQDVKAKTLANPSIRVLDKEKAKIHIGDRVPLRTSDILDATGQTRTTFEYQEIGIRLSVEPTIHINDYVTIRMALEVSSLGENLGTQDQQAYRIGTRNAETVMYVKNGQTAILGGLIRGEERTSESSVPFLGEIPYLNRLFRSDSETTQKSDVLLTITPKIIRANLHVSQFQDSLAVGTANKLSLDPYADLYQLKLQALKDNIVIEEDKTSDAVYLDQETVTEAFVLNNESPDKRDVNTTSQQNAPPSSLNEGPMRNDDSELTRELVFSQDQYFIDTGQNIEVNSYLTVPGEFEKISYEIFFNPDIVQFLSAELDDSGSAGLDIQYENGNNVVVFTFSAEGKHAESNFQTNISFRGKRSGTSFLVMRGLDGTFRDGSGINIDVKNSRIKVQ